MITNSSLCYWIAELNAEFKSYGSAGAAETDANDKKGGENSLEEIVALEDEHLLDDQGAEDEDKASGNEEAADGELHLLAEEVHHRCNEDTRCHSNKADHNAKG